MKNIQKYQEQVFEKLKHYTGEETEFWFARELQGVLEYSEWRNFATVVHKAQRACANSGHEVSDHFVEVNKMVGLGSGAEREIDDIMLSMPEDPTLEKSIQQIEKEQKNIAPKDAK
jgi:DNA-damage-inducible protein D